MTDVPIDPADWGRHPYAIVATNDLICFLRNPATFDAAALRAQVNAPDSAVVLIHGASDWDTAPVEWMCHVCHRMRPDDAISVVQVPLSSTIAGTDLLLGTVPAFNVRYCNDCETCTELATTATEWPLTSPYQGCVAR